MVNIYLKALYRILFVHFLGPFPLLYLLFNGCLSKFKQVFNILAELLRPEPVVLLDSQPQEGVRLQAP